MKNHFLIRLLCLLTVFALTLSTVGCNKKPAEADSSAPSSEQKETEQTIEEEPPYEEDVFVPEPEVEEEYPEDLTTDDGTIATIHVENKTGITQKNFLGLNGVYHGYTYLPDKLNRVYTEEQAQMDFDRIADIGISNVRTFYNSNYAYEEGRFDWENKTMQGFYRWLKEMQEREIDVALNAGWGLEGLYNENYWAPWSGLFVQDDEAATIRNYTNWVITSLEQFRARGINNVKYLIMFTEPSTFQWNAELTKNASECRDLDPTIDRWLKTTKALHNALKEANIRDDYKIVGPNEHNRTLNPDGTYMTPLFYHTVLEAKDYVDVFSCHSYFDLPDMTSDIVNSIYEMYFTHRIDHVKNNTNREFWIDETNVRLKGATDAGLAKKSPWHAMHMSLVLANAMNSGVQNVVMWAIADQQWPNSMTSSNDGFVSGVQRSGIFPSFFESSLPRLTYYGTSLLTKYFGKEATVYRTHAMWYGLSAAAQKNNHGEYSLLATNMTVSGDLRIAFEFEKSIGKQTFYRHLYDITAEYAGTSTKVIGVDKIITTSGNRMVDTLPPGCIAVYTTEKD